MALLTKKKVLAASIESEIGTAETLEAADAAFDVFDVAIQPNIPFVERNGQSAFSPLAGVQAGKAGRVTFRKEIDTAGAVPGWADVFFPAVGLVKSSTTFYPKSELPGSNCKTITIGIYENGRYKALAGCMGNAVFHFIAGEPVSIDFDFMGTWVTPSDVVILAPNYPGTLPCIFKSSSLAIGGWSPQVREITVDLGNNVIMREDSLKATGYLCASITGRRITGTIDPEAVVVATKDTHDLWTDSTESALTMTIENATADVSISIPKLQITDIQAGDRNGVLTDQISFQANRSADAGDDEFSITFNAA